MMAYRYGLVVTKNHDVRVAAHCSISFFSKWSQFEVPKVWKLWLIQFPQQCSPLRASVPPVCKAARTVFNKCKYRCWSRNRNLNHIERVHFWNDLSTFERQSLVFQPGLCSRACLAWAVIDIANSIIALESLALRLYCWDVESMTSFTVHSSQSPLPCPHYLQSLHAQKLNPPPTLINNNSLCERWLLLPLNAFSDHVIAWRQEVCV